MISAGAFMLGLYIGLPVAMAADDPVPLSVIRTKGSDTMVDMARAWTERYRQNHPEVVFSVDGGGSGNGIAALINGHVDLAHSSRALRSQELRVINKRRHQILQEHVVGWDALSVVVHPDNPLVGVTIEQLAQIYSGDSELQRWSDLGITVPGCDGQAIVAGSRRPSSGTYQFFRDVLFQEKRRKLNGRRHYQESSHAMIAWVARTPCAIGYSGIGHVTGAVRTLCIRPDPARQECIMPSLENTRQTSYPMMRPLYIYLLTEPTQALRDYLAWIMGPDGRAILRQKGFIDGVMAEMTAPATDNK